MPNCAVATCTNRNRNIVGKGIVLHQFPKDEVMRKIWHIKCRRLDEINFKHARVCSEHFLPEDYEPDLRSELLGLPPRKRLKKTAVPSLVLPGCSTSLKEKAKGRRGRKRVFETKKLKLDKETLAEFERINQQLQLQISLLKPRSRKQKRTEKCNTLQGKREFKSERE